MPNATPGSLVAFADVAPAPMAPWAPGRLLGMFRGDPAAALAAVTLAVIALAALFAPWLAPFDPAQISDIAARAEPPSVTHWLGTDQLSRDLFSRLLYAARLSLAIALLAVTVAMV